MSQFRRAPNFHHLPPFGIPPFTHTKIPNLSLPLTYTCAARLLAPLGPDRSSVFSRLAHTCVRPGEDLERGIPSARAHCFDARPLQSPWSLTPLSLPFAVFRAFSDLCLLFERASCGGWNLWRPTAEPRAYSARERLRMQEGLIGPSRYGWTLSAVAWLRALPVDISYVLIRNHKN